MVRRRLSSILSSSFGNILEWYDFGLFTIFSSLFSKLFFPAEDPRLALIATFGIFSIGFLCRPIGALLFGYWGDKRGRAITLRLSVLMISLPTLLIAFLPTYAQAGVFAPISLTVIRMWQGISIGGEYSGNMIYLAETAPRNYRATFTSLAGIGANFGILLAALVGIITTTFFAAATIEAWGWRVPYLISGIISLVIYIFRLRLQETYVFKYLKHKHLLPTNPIHVVFTTRFPELMRTLGMVCMGTTFYYFCFVFLPLYLRANMGFSINRISILMSALIAVMILFLPIAGLICDKVGRRKMLLFNASIVSLTLIPGYYIIGLGSFLYAAIILLVFTVASAFEQGTTGIAVVENFPPQARYTGVSVGYNVGNGFLGGTTPMVCAWLATMSNFPLAPACYIAFFAVLTGLVVFFFVPETKDMSLKSSIPLKSIY